MNPTHSNRLLVAVVVLGAIAAGISAYLMLSTPSTSQLPASFALYEDGEYRWYALRGATVVAAAPPIDTDSQAPFGTNEGGSSIRISDEGVEQFGEGLALSDLILAEPVDDRASAAVSLEGDAAILFNSVTGAFDVYSVDLMQGGGVSYVSSFLPPAQPSYVVAVGFAPGGIIVVRTGDPSAFELYQVEGGAVVHTGTAYLSNI